MSFVIKVIRIDLIHSVGTTVSTVDMLVYQISVAGELQADIAGASDFSLDEMRDLTSHRPFSLSIT